MRRKIVPCDEITEEMVVEQCGAQAVLHFHRPIAHGLSIQEKKHPFGGCVAPLANKQSGNINKFACASFHRYYHDSMVLPTLKATLRRPFYTRLRWSNPSCHSPTGLGTIRQSETCRGGGTSDLTISHMAAVAWLTRKYLRTGRG